MTPSRPRHKKILAIDISSRVPNFRDESRAYSEQEPLIVATSDEALLAIEDGNAHEVDLVAISIHQPLTEHMLEQLASLKTIAILGTSQKKIPLAYCASHQIEVKNITEYCDHATAEWVIWRIFDFIRNRREPMSLQGRRLGIVGMGAVGHHVARMAMGLGMEVLFFSRTPRADLIAAGAQQAHRLEQVFSTSKIISLHTPAQLVWLTSALLEKLPAQACLINTCMGRLSVDDDLLQTLKRRPDITVVFDKIAMMAYPELNDRAQGFEQEAFNTIDSQQCLLKKFWDNLA